MDPSELSMDALDDKAPAAAAEDGLASQAADAAKTRLRIRFTKSGDLRWISHRDLARVWERLLRRAGLQLAFSQGFHPKPRISFPSALALGIEALDEVVELEVLGEVNLASIGDVLRREMPPGMELLELQELTSGLGKARVLGASYQIPHGLAEPSAAATALEFSPTSPSGAPVKSDNDWSGPPANLAELRQRLADILHQPELRLLREGKSITCQTNDPFFHVGIEGECFVFALPHLAQGSIRPSELLAHVGLAQLLEDGVTLQRTAVRLWEPPEPPQNT